MDRREMIKERDTSKSQKEIGRRVRMLREDMDLTQEEVRDRVRTLLGTSLSQNYLSDLEKGKRVPSGKNLVALAQFFGVTTDYLLLLSDVPATPDSERNLVIPIEDEYQRKVAEEAVELLLELPTEQQRHMLETIRMLRGPRRPRIFGDE